MRGNLFRGEGVVINCHFVDGTLDRVTDVATPGVGADLDPVREVAQERSASVAGRSNLLSIDVISRPGRSDYSRHVVPNGGLEVEGHAAYRQPAAPIAYVEM